MKKCYKIIFLLLIAPILCFAKNEPTISKQKNLKKTYSVNSNAGIYIDNSYGTVFVTTWNEDKIELDITIKVSGDSEKWVNERLNNITIDLSALTNMVTAKTIIQNSKQNHNGRNNSFEINYVVKIPKNGTTKINNKYGNIATTDLHGATDISCKYGKITLGKLYNTNNSILIEYCNGSTINYLKSANVTARYSEVSIDEVSKLELLSDYTDTSINNAGDVKYTSKYGAIKIQNTSKIEGQGNYMTLKIGTLRHQLKIQTKYSSLTVGLVEAKANNIAINSAYTGVKIGFDPNYVFDFDVSLKYADLKYDSEFDFSSKSETNYTKEFKGFYKKKGVNLVSITSEYGNVSLIKKQ